MSASVHSQNYAFFVYFARRLTENRKLLGVFHARNEQSHVGEKISQQHQ